MLGKKLHAIDVAWILGLAGAGVVLLLAAVVLQPSAAVGIVPNLFGQMGALLIATGVLGFGFDLFGKREIAEGAVEQYALAEMVRQVGLEGVSFTRQREPLAQHPSVASIIIDTTSDDIRLLIANGSRIESDLRMQLANAAERGARIIALVPRSLPDAPGVKEALKREVDIPDRLEILDVDSDGTVFAIQSPSYAIFAHSESPAGGGPYVVLAGGAGPEGDNKFYVHVSDYLSKLAETAVSAVPTRAQVPAVEPVAGARRGGTVASPASGRPLSPAEMELMTGSGRRAADARPLEPLVRNGWVKEGSTLLWTYKGKRYEAVVQADGALVTQLGRFTNPSAAANKVLDSGQVSGWEAWKYEGQPLRAVRERASAASE